jgi:hypothetical protein
VTGQEAAKHVFAHIGEALFLGYASEQMCQNGREWERECGIGGGWGADGGVVGEGKADVEHTIMTV